MVTREVKPYALMMGVPARQVGWWSAWGGERIDPHPVGSGSWICPHTSVVYHLQDGLLTCVETTDSSKSQI